MWYRPHAPQIRRTPCAHRPLSDAFPEFRD